MPVRSSRPWQRARQQVQRTGGNICWLCGQPIDYELPVSDPMSFTVDHVQPRSLGGAELDPANLRPAHKSCNSSRGDGTRKRLPTSRRW